MGPGTPYIYIYIYIYRGIIIIVSFLSNPWVRCMGMSSHCSSI